ncbi:hypothetical protein GcC1_100026 [Golovinomyces cichoracearum]|uniref:Uncharacterized protein n=1 Tax=Golovinomyces cichoracearum TaxID=62708 RepID=A0A420IA67_9PEZI|nr:hypothetical protein GcC1_100026 [Golovinomyces cichoracearum]
MAPESLTLRIQSLMHIQNPLPSSFKYSFLHLMRRDPKKRSDITSTKSSENSTSQKNSLRNLGKVARGMPALTSTKYQTPKTQLITTSKIILPAPPEAKMETQYKLPQLTPVNISLTEGTNIPSPSESPVDQTLPNLEECQSTIADEDSPPSLVEPTTNSISSQEVDEEPTFKKLSLPIPLSSKRPSSVRKFLSRRSLNANFINESHETLNVSRPDSSMSYMSASKSFSGGKRRNFNWLSRFYGDSAGHGFLKKRTSIVIEENVAKEPPVPMLPKLSQFKAMILEDDGGLGGEDLFKDIK